MFSSRISIGSFFIIIIIFNYFAAVILTFLNLSMFSFVSSNTVISDALNIHPAVSSTSFISSFVLILSFLEYMLHLPISSCYKKNLDSILGIEDNTLKHLWILSGSFEKY